MDAKTEQKPGPISEPEEDALDFDKAEGAEEMPQLDAESNFEHTLSKPIQAHGEEVRVVRWREPTGGDIERAGNPVYLDFSGASPTMTFNEKKMAQMISVLCQLPPSSIRQMSARDWNAVAWKLFRFFTPPGA